MPPNEQLDVLIVGVEPGLSALVANLLRRESATVRELFGCREAASVPPADVVLAAEPVARHWIRPWPVAISRLVVLAPGAGDDAVVSWLHAGADDVVTGGGRPAEVVARIRSVARRGGGAPIAVGDTDEAVPSARLVVDATRHEVRVRGTATGLSPRQFRLLELLVENHGRVLTREVIIERVWEVDEPYRFLNALQVQIKRLRDAIEEDPARPRMIQTVRGIGYRFDHPTDASRGS